MSGKPINNTTNNTSNKNTKNISNDTLSNSSNTINNNKKKKDCREYSKKNKNLKLEHREPEKYKNIINDLKEGKSLTETASNNNVARSTVDRIKYDNKDQLIQWKWRQSQKIGEIIEKGLKVLDENIDNVPKASLPLALGILIDKKDHFDSTIAPETQKSSVVAHVNLNDLIDKLSTDKSKLPAVAPKTIDI